MNNGKDNVLIIGSGGREHAIASAISHSSFVGTIYCAPGNPGMANVATVVPLNINNQSEVLQFINDKKIKLTIIGPEAPLVAGLSDYLRAEGKLVVGASKKAAQLEGSKVFAKEFMFKHGIPTANYKLFNNLDECNKFIQSKESDNYKVLKVDGLAAGKGVFVTSTKSELLDAVKLVMEEKKFGSAGDKIILEETLEGPEVSIIALTDGKTILPFPASQDHKRVSDNDEGPNTGGMGAYAPTPYLNDNLRMTINKNIFENFLKGLSVEKLDFRGIIYFGLMLTPQGPKVLEFNVRFGDPETQAILPLIESDLYQAFLSVSNGTLASASLQTKPGFACTVVMTSGGYPGDFETGFPIYGLSDVERKNKSLLFHAGTKRVDREFVTAGGRVLNVTGIGKSLDQAVVRAYQGVKKISFKNAHYRQDIAAKSLKNKNILNRIKKMKQRHDKDLQVVKI